MGQSVKTFMPKFTALGNLVNLLFQLPTHNCCKEMCRLEDKDGVGHGKGVGDLLDDTKG